MFVKYRWLQDISIWHQNKASESTFNFSILICYIGQKNSISNSFFNYVAYKKTDFCHLDLLLVWRNPFPGAFHWGSMHILRSLGQELKIKQHWHCNRNLHFKSLDTNWIITIFDSTKSCKLDNFDDFNIEFHIQN